MNPILPINHFVPDAEAREMPDGRLYLYGSYDISGSETYCSDKLFVFSSENLIEWKNHGLAFSCKDVPWVSDSAFLYAPDCIHKDGKYYLYFCLSDGSEGVAESENPWGPFENPQKLEFKTGTGIDPAIFVDDDGQAYYFWGQFQLHGAKLNSDMKSIMEGSEREYILDEKRHGFHEGASIRKYNGKYYMVYTDLSRGRATCLGYATADHPMGPYKKEGIIIDNTWCDPETWNNHGCIASFKDKWYVFYHRSSQNSRYNRRMCIEPIKFEESGKICEVCMTSQGCEGSLDPGKGISVSQVCRMNNGAFLYPENESEEVLSNLMDGAWAEFKYVQMNGETRCKVECASLVNGGVIEIWADDEVIGHCVVEPTGGWNVWKEFTCELKAVYGKKTLYFVFKGKDWARRLMEMKRFIFE